MTVSRLLPLLFYFVAASAQQQTPLYSSSAVTDVLNPSTDQFIRSVLSEWNTPGGVAVAVVRKDFSGEWRVETKGYGNASLDGTPMTEDSLFGIASNSKLFDVIATGLLITNESLSPRLSWDTKIASVVPDDEWGLMDPLATTESTIIDLMSHRTGLPRHDLMYGRSDNITSILRRMRHLRPSAGFRTLYQYNNNMYMLLSYLPELVLPHRPTIARYVKEHIFEPLGLTATTYSIDVAQASGKLAQGMARENMKHAFDLGTPREMWFPNWWLDRGEDGNYKSGAGGIIMSARDAATWLRVLLLGGKNPLTMEQVIPEAVIEMVATGVSVVTGKAEYPELSPAVYGGAQSRYSYRGHEIIEHGGSTTGFMSQIARFPSDGLGIAVFSNDDEYGGTLHTILKWYLADVALGLKPIDWDGRMKKKVLQKYTRESRPRPINPPSASLPFSELGGSYGNRGYGALELCLLDDPSATSQSASCAQVVADAPETLPGAINGSVPTFLAKWEKAWSTHIKLEHFAGDLFNVTELESRRIANTRDVKYWAAPVHEGNIVTAEFAFKDGRVVGFGLVGGIWGAGDGAKSPTGASIVERAEVWFDKT